MTTYALDAAGLGATYTGNVNPVDRWENGAKVGQAADDNGEALWKVEIMRTVENFGQRSTVVQDVIVSSGVQPVVRSGSSIAFQGLTLNVYPRKGGGMAENLSASGISTASANTEQAKA